MEKAFTERVLLYEPDSSMKTNKECQSGEPIVVDGISSVPSGTAGTANISTRLSVEISPLLLLEIPLVEIRPATPEIFEARGLLRDGQDREIYATIDALRVQQLAVRHCARQIRLGLNQAVTSPTRPGTNVANPKHVCTKPCNVKEVLIKAQEEWASLVKETRRVEMSVKTYILARGISGQLKECHRGWVMSRLRLHQMEMVELQEELCTLQKAVEPAVPGKWFSMPKLGLATEKVRDLLRRK